MSHRLEIWLDSSGKGWKKCTNKPADSVPDYRYSKVLARLGSGINNGDVERVEGTLVLQTPD